MMRIPWTDKVCNEDVLSRAQVKRKLMYDIRVKQLNFLGHIIRKDGLENLAMTGRIEGKRSRSRRRVTWMSSVKGWLQERGVKHQEVELIERTRNRKLWHDKIAYVYLRNHVANTSTWNLRRKGGLNGYQDIKILVFIVFYS